MIKSRTHTQTKSIFAALALAAGAAHAATTISILNGDFEDDFGDGLVLFSLWGSQFQSSTLPPFLLHRSDDLEQGLAVLLAVGEGLDMCELCGGEARSSKVAIRRRLSTGRNFDLVTGCDLNKPHEQRLVLTKFPALSEVVEVTYANRRISLSRSE